MSNGVPEKQRLDLGFIPLSDCAPLVVAKELGYFAKQGLDVNLCRQASWASIRDKMAVGALDGAHMLAAMPLALSLGMDALHVPMVVPMALSLNGNAITVSTALYRAMQEADPVAMTQAPLSARALQQIVAQRRRQGLPPLRFAMVFPFSTHNYLLRYWLASAGIDPDEDIQLSVVPPPHMVDALRAGRIDGYCVGEPWNARAVADGVGRVVITSYELWNNHPEKVLGVRQDWAERYPNTLRALLMALLEASQWMDTPHNRNAVVELVAQEAYVNAPVEVVRMTMAGSFAYAADSAPQPSPDFNVFHRYAATFPWLSHAEWLLTQMLRWGQTPSSLDIQHAAASVYRPDLYRSAAQALGLLCPSVDRKREGEHAEPWVMDAGRAALTLGADRFFDGLPYDPADPLAYLHSLTLRRERAAVRAA